MYTKHGYPSFERLKKYICFNFHVDLVTHYRVLGCKTVQSSYRILNFGKQFLVFDALDYTGK